MILLELFSGVLSTRELDDAEIFERLDASVVSAVELSLDSKTILIWFSRADIAPNAFSCSFAETNLNGRKLVYSPTNTGDQFKVFNAVVNTVQEFLTMHRPDLLSISGWSTRQSELYIKIIKRVGLPPGYDITTSGEELYIYNTKSSVLAKIHGNGNDW